MFTVTDVLLVAGIRPHAYHGWPAGNVFLTPGNQLIATFRNLEDFRTCFKGQDSSGNTYDYKGWHRHHIVEYDDLMRLGVAHNAPPYEDQVCVLLPERAHIGRINSVLRRANPTKWHASARELRQAYAEAYQLMGDYCQGGAQLIRRELLSIVNAVFQKLGVP